MKLRSYTPLSLVDRFIDLIEGSPRSDRFLLRVTFLSLIGIAIWALLAINQNYSILTPIKGGIINEGIVGTPRFINPALALTRADQDVTALVYDGLLKLSPEGLLVNNLAESITVSDDGLTYNIKLRKDISFHDGTPLTARDLVFTIQLIQDPDLKSPLRGNWTNVEIQEIDEYELNVVLREVYSPFMENFTLGIMPAHIWSSLPIEQLPFSQLNTEPIGSGPFRIENTKRDPSGLISHYTLQAFHQNRPDPNIDTVELSFFTNEAQLIEALQNNTIDSTGYLSPENINQFTTNNRYHLIEEPLPKIFGIFLNQNKSPALRDIAVREALTKSIDRSALIKTTLYDHGVPTNQPITKEDIGLESTSNINDSPTTTPTSILEKAGWKRSEQGQWEKEIDKEKVILSVTIRTSNIPLFETVLTEITKSWQDLGVEVTTEQFEQTGLVQSVIRPRDFQALLFGLDTNRSYDLYPFWHSSQQDDPGLNISQYANTKVDTLLEEARKEQEENARQEKLLEASTLITEDVPAIFLFRPMFSYVVNDDTVMPEMNRISRPSDRFSNIELWHTESEPLWPLFH